MGRELDEDGALLRCESVSERPVRTLKDYRHIIFPEVARFRKSHPWQRLIGAVYEIVIDVVAGVSSRCAVDVIVIDVAAGVSSRGTVDVIAIDVVAGIFSRGTVDVIFIDVVAGMWHG